MEKFFKSTSKKQGNSKKNNSEPICPYCKNVLSRKPQRKTKCPFCNNDIYVRGKQNIFSSTLLNKEDAIVADWLKKLDIFGIKDSDFINKKKELSNKFGTEANSTDTIWGLFNELILRTRDLHSLKLIYYEMALFLNKKGKDCFSLLQQSTKMELLRLKQDDFVKNVRVLIANNGSCEKCTQLKNKVFTIDKALEIMPIPHKECAHKLYDKKRGFCRCSYLAEFD